MFKKKLKVKKTLGTSFDRLLNYNFNEEADIDEQIFQLADSILGNCPVLINFEKVKDNNKINRVLSFLSGVIYSVEGESYPIGRNSYLFATDQAFSDGSLHKWVKDFGHYIDD